MGSEDIRRQEMLAALRTRVLVMCVSVGAALDNACAAFLERDAARARAVLDGDAAIDVLENDIDERALRLLALTQPVARDLRQVVSGLRMATDLERIGDEAAGLAQGTILLGDVPPHPVLDDVAAFLDQARAAFAGAVAAFRDDDVPAARHISRNEDEAAQTEVRILQRLMETLSGGGPALDSCVAMQLILMIRSLTRIWRRAANMAEHVCFACEGVNLRHSMTQQGVKSPAPDAPPLLPRS